MWRRLLSHTEVWEDRECTVLTTEASAGRWLRPVHETDDFSSYANPVVEVELLEDSCRGWVNIADNIQLSARETEEHALRASRRYRGHRGLLYIPNVVAFVTSHAARTPQDLATYRQGGTIGPSSFDAPGFIQSAFANSTVKPVFIPRHTHQQHHFAEPVDDLNEVRQGDLVFFGRHPTNGVNGDAMDVDHVGMITEPAYAVPHPNGVVLKFVSVTAPRWGRGGVGEDAVLVPRCRDGVRWEYRASKPGPGSEGDSVSEYLARRVAGVGRIRRGVEGRCDLPVSGHTRPSGRCGGSSRCSVQISQKFDPNHGVSHLDATPVGSSMGPGKGIDLSTFSWDTEVDPRD